MDEDTDPFRLTIKKYNDYLIDEKFSKSFEYIGSHDAIMEQILDLNPFKKSFVQKWLSKCSNESFKKCSISAKKLRLEGNEYFKQNNFAKALAFYNKALCFSDLSIIEENTNSEYVLCLANRSAVLYHQKNFKCCIDDIEEALKNNYEPNSKLKMRRAQCYFHLNQLLEAKNELLQLKVMQDKKVGEKEMDSWLIKINDKEKLIGHKINLTFVEQMQKNDCDSVFGCRKVKGNDKNEKIPFASQYIDCKFSKEKQRYLIAKDKLDIGDVLIVEQPYVCLLLPTHYDKRCYNCLKSLENFFVCLSCSSVKYCSVLCRNISWQAHHYIECAILPLLQQVGIAHLAFRIIVVTAKPQNIFDLLKSKELWETTEPPENMPIPYNNDYRSVYGLVHNTHCIQKQDLLHYALTSAFLLSCLEYSNYLSIGNFRGNDYLHNYSSSRTALAGLLLRHICQLICNAHAVSDLELTQISGSSLVESESQVRIATAIYPTVSLMNHSCDPNIISSFHGNELVVKALKPIQPGEEIFNCYGPHYKRMNKIDRQKLLLEQYYFICKCTACVQQSDGDDLREEFLCERCNGRLIATTDFNDHDQHSQGVPNENILETYKCLTCHSLASSEHISSILKVKKESIRLFELGNFYLTQQKQFKEAKTMFENCYKLMLTVFQPDNITLGQVLDALAQASALMGDFVSSEKYLKSSLKIVKKFYGDISVEYANDLKKYSEVCFQAGLSQKAKPQTNELIDKAKSSATESMKILKKINCDASEVEQILKDILQVRID